jgi:cystathionine beta-lyase/cystathionine gamma-synthase
VEPSAPRPSGRFATRAVHGAQVPEVAQSPVSPPIHLSSTWATDTSEEIGRILEDELDGYVYGRYDNPTSTALHAQVASLHGTAAAWSAASGIAAIHAVLASIRDRAGPSARVLADRRLYGGTVALLRRLAERSGWQIDTAALDGPDDVEAALTGDHALVYVETMANPTVAIADLPGIASAASTRGVPVVVDNTFASPWLCRPIEHGATIVVESATKLLGGHGDVVAGVVAGPADLIAGVRAMIIDLGASLGPFESWLVSRGIQTLPLRVDHAGQSAARIAAELDADDRVRAVHHPSLASHPSHDRARHLFGGRGFGTILAFDLGDRPAAEAFADGCEVITRAVSLGSTHSLVVHAASTTHRQLDDAELRDAGVGPGLIRLSVGIEDPDDLVADVRRGLQAASSRQNASDQS